MELVKLVANTDTLVKDYTGSKVKVKAGEEFQTDSRTAETYLRAYKNIFSVAGKSDSEEATLDVIENNARNDLQKEVDETKEKLIVALELLQYYKLDALYNELGTTNLDDIKYNDMKKIASIIGMKFKENPNTEVLRKAIKGVYENGGSDSKLFTLIPLEENKNLLSTDEKEVKESDVESGVPAEGEVPGEDTSTGEGSEASTDTPEE